jgi:hypothetical protein
VRKKKPRGMAKPRRWDRSLKALLHGKAKEKVKRLQPKLREESRRKVSLLGK